MRNGLGTVVSPVRIRIGECQGNLRRADESDLFESAKTLSVYDKLSSRHRHHLSSATRSIPSARA